MTISSNKLANTTVKRVGNEVHVTTRGGYKTVHPYEDYQRVTSSYKKSANTSDGSYLSVVAHRLRQGSGNPNANSQALKTSKAAIKAVQDADQGALKKRMIGIGAAGLGAIAAPVALGALGAGAGAAGTGISAGNAAGIGGLKFATGAAAKGALAGGLSGLASGDGLKGVLKGAALGGVTGGYGGSLGTSLGLNGVPLNTFKNALTGTAAGYATGGGLKAAAIGGGLGALSGAYGTPAGTPLSGGMQGPTRGTGIAGVVTRAVPSLGDAARGISTMARADTEGSLPSTSSSYADLAGPLTDLYSGYKARETQDDLERKLLEQQMNSQEALSPYTEAGADAARRLQERLDAGFNPGDLTETPGYQFRMKEGERALNRSLSANGKLFSGDALKATTEYGQGLADQAWDAEYSKWQQENDALSAQANQGLNATGALTGVYDNMGNIRANRTVAKSNILNSTLSALSGRGNRKIVGYRNDGSPIYADGGM